MTQILLLGLVACCGAVSTTDIWADAEASSETPSKVNPAHLGEVRCSVNVGLSMSRLLTAGLDISGATKACTQVSDINLKKASTRCIMEMTSVIAALAHVGEFLLDGMASCPGIATGGTQCTSALVGLIGDLNTVVSAAVGIKSGFHHGHCQGTDQLTADAMRGGVRENILDAFDISAPYLKNASCANDATSALGFLVASGTTIATATKSCAKGRQDCFITATSVIQALAYAGSFIALMVQDCTFQQDHKAICAGKISQLVAGVTGLAAHGGRLVSGCGLHLNNLGGELPDLAEKLSGMYSTNDLAKVGSGASRAPFALLLVALLPFTALLGFVAGARWGRREGLDAQQQGQE